MTEKLPDTDSRALALMITLMQHSNAENMHLLNTFAASYKRDFEREQARVRLIRARIISLCDQPYLPHPGLILDALYPSDNAIEALLPPDSPCPADRDAVRSDGTDC